MPSVKNSIKNVVSILQFKNDAAYSSFTVAGESFSLTDGIFGLAVSPPSCKTDRKLYYHSLAAVTENAVSLSVINNPANWANPNSQSAAFTVIGSRGIQTPGLCKFSGF